MYLYVFIFSLGRFVGWMQKKKHFFCVLLVDNFCQLNKWQINLYTL